MHDHFDFIDLVNTQMMYSLYVAFVLRFVLITNCNGSEKENELRRTKTKTKHMAKKYQQKKWGRHTTKLQKKRQNILKLNKKRTTHTNQRLYGNLSMKMNSRSGSLLPFSRCYARCMEINVHIQLAFANSFILRMEFDVW